MPPLRRFFRLPIRPALLATGASVLLSACSKDPNVNASNSTRTVKGKKEKERIIALDPASGEAALYNKYAFDPNSLKRDEQGNFVGAVRSQYDGQKNIAFGGGIGKAAYKTKRYNSSEWTGRKTAVVPEFSAETDGGRFETRSRYQGARSSQDGERSRFQGATARTSSYRTGNAVEGSSQRLDKPTDAWTDFRRAVYPQPPKISEADYNKLTVDQTRSILGREE